MAPKCVHKGCGKEFTDPDGQCFYHPGPPVFHEGQKGKDLVASPIQFLNLKISTQWYEANEYCQAGNAANPVSSLSKNSSKSHPAPPANIPPSTTPPLSPQRKPKSTLPSLKAPP